MHGKEKPRALFFQWKIKRKQSISSHKNTFSVFFEKALAFSIFL